jgi:hypothetical protein
LASIYRQVLGEDFERLAPELRSFHDLRGYARFRGECRIEAARGAVARVLRWLLRLPGAVENAGLDFELTAGADRDVWIRHFPGCTMRSTLQAVDGRLVERIGPVGCWFSLELEGDLLTMKLSRVTVFGVAWPRGWMPQVWGNERGSDGRLYFDAGVRFPGVGLVTAYRGYLAIPAPRP